METIKYKIGKRKKEHNIRVDVLLAKFKDSKEAENYSTYYFPFKTCMDRFLMEEIRGIQPLSEGQYIWLERFFLKSK